MSTQNSTTSGQQAEEQDLAVFVQNLLEQMQSKFEQMSDSIIQRIDEMGTRIDELEKSIGDLMQQAQLMEHKEGDKGKNADVPE